HLASHATTHARTPCRTLSSLVPSCAWRGECVRRRDVSARLQTLDRAVRAGFHVARVHPRSEYTRALLRRCVRFPTRRYEQCSPPAYHSAPETSTFFGAAAHRVQSQPSQ